MAKYGKHISGGKDIKKLFGIRIPLFILLLMAALCGLFTVRGVISAAAASGTSVVNEYGFADGDGSKSDPFVITTPAQLDNMRNFLNKENPDYVPPPDYVEDDYPYEPGIDYTIGSEDDYAGYPDDDGKGAEEPEFLPYYFMLGADIDLSAALAPGGELYGDGNGWMPIGSGAFEEGFSWEKNYFYGKLDGRKHCINGLWINRGETDSVGLFGAAFDIAVTNLNMILGEKDITGKLNAGAIAGIINSNYGTNLIKNCSVTGNIKTTSREDNLHGLGGFAGFSSLLEIDNSSFEGGLNGAGRTGGLTGGADWVSVQNCYVKVIVRTAKHSEAGGIFGYASKFGHPQSLYKRIGYCFVDLICETDTDPFAGDVIEQFDLGFSYYALREHVVLNDEKYYINSVAALNEQQQKNKSAYKDFDFDTVWGFDKNGNLILRALKEAYDPPEPLNLTWLYIMLACAAFAAAAIIIAVMLYRRKKAVIVKETVVKTETVYIEKEPAEPRLPDILSAREMEIALELLAGTPRAYIAKKHFISDGTVRNHIIHIYRKTGCASQIDFILKYGNAKNKPPEEP